MEHAVAAARISRAEQTIDGRPAATLSCAVLGEALRRLDGEIRRDLFWRESSFPNVEAQRPAALVHVVDQDRDLPEHLKELVTPFGWQTRAYRDLNSFLERDKCDIVGCLIVDARLPWVTGIGPRTQLPALGIDLPTVVTGSHATVPMAVRAMQAGAVDFLEKPCDETRVLDAIGAAIEADRSRRASAARKAELRGRFDSLSRREREVMALVTAGKLNKQVAWELGVSEITVKVHRGSVMRKMAARTLADLVRMADALLDLPEGTGR